MSTLLASQAPAATSTSQIHLSLYAGAEAAFPLRRDDMTWPEVVASLRDIVTRLPDAPPTADVDTQKKAMLAWAPHRLRPDAGRSIANVLEVTLLVLDVDRCDLGALLDRLDDRNAPAFVYASPSDTPDDRRVRVVAPMSRALATNEECHRTRKAWAESLGLGPDSGVDQAKDSSRIFFAGRLHNTPERECWEFPYAPVGTVAYGRSVTVDVDALLAVPLAHAWGAAPARKARTQATARGTSPHLERARAMAQRLPPSVEGEGGDQALLVAATELATVLEGDAATITEVLATTFNARCLPPWPEAKLAREAERAADRYHTPEAQYGRRHAERAGLAGPGVDPFRPAAVTAVTASELGHDVDLSTPAEPIRYLCEGLGLGWVGKCAGVHGYAGSSKGLFLSLVALCVASGVPCLGHEVARVPVVYGDAETGPLAENRIKRLATALGLDLGTLQSEGWFRFAHLDRSLVELLPALEQATRAADKGAGVLVALDSYSSLVSGDENASDYADPLWALGRLGRDCNAVPMVTMHERKGDRAGRAANPLEGISGTNRLAAALSTSIRLTPSEENDREILVTCTRAPEKRFEPKRLTWVDAADGGLRAATEQATVTTTKDKVLAARDDRKRATLEARADSIEKALESPQFATTGRPVTARTLRVHLHLNGDNWREALELCGRRGTVAVVPGTQSGSMAIQLVRGATPPRPGLPHGKFGRGLPRLGERDK